MIPWKDYLEEEPEHEQWILVCSRPHYEKSEPPWDQSVVCNSSRCTIGTQWYTRHKTDAVDSWEIAKEMILKDGLGWRYWLSVKDSIPEEYRKDWVGK